jgi:hypothetical protein
MNRNFLLFLFLEYFLESPNFGVVAKTTYFTFRLIFLNPTPMPQTGGPKKVKVR